MWLNAHILHQGHSSHVMMHHNLDDLDDVDGDRDDTDDVEGDKDG